MLRISDELERYNNQNVHKYLSESHINKGVWATDAEILTTSNLFGVDIHVYCDYGSTKDWLTYPAALCFSQKKCGRILFANINVVLNVEC